MTDHLFTIGLILLVLLCGGIAKGAIDQIERNIQAEADEGLKNATPKARAPWYWGNCEEVSRTCRAEARLSKVKGKAT